MPKNKNLYDMSIARNTTIVVSTHSPLRVESIKLSMQLKLSR